MYWKRKLIWLTVLLILIAALVYGFRPQPQLVSSVEVIRASMQVAVEEEGKTRVIDRYVVSAPVAGTTCRVDLNVGDYVAKEQPLLTIEPLISPALDPRSLAEAKSKVAAYQSALGAAEQSAKSARAEAQLASKELSRLRPLTEKGHIAQDKLDQAATLARSLAAAKRSADFAVAVARHELEAARTALQYTGVKGEDNPAANVQVRSPVKGRILKIHQQCEGVVSTGQPLLEVGDTQSLEIETDVLSADAIKIKPGMIVEFHRWGGQAPLQGQVRTVEPVGFTKVSALGVEEQRVLVISDIISEIEQWELLGDGYRVEARFILWENNKILQVPASALFRLNDKWAVCVMQNEKAKRRIVKVGQRNGLSAQILEGLTEGEKVITHPDDTIEDGVAVKQR